MPRHRSKAREPKAIEFARNQRKNQNDFANAVWQMVRNRRCREAKFRREYPIPPYTADFCCVELKLIIEVDGKHHLTEDGVEHDTARDEYLKEFGYEILHIPGFKTLKEPEKVRKQIEDVIENRRAE